MDEGEIITDPIKIAEIMNKAYIQKPIDIVNKIPETNTDPLINYKKLVRDKNQELEFELKTINMEDLRRIVKNLKPTTSAGTDTINMKTIKENMKTIEPALLNIVNTSISTNTYPDNLKTQLILPALKPKKDSLKPLSYRPINIIETIGKIIETAVKEQTMEYLIKKQPNTKPAQWWTTKPLNNNCSNTTNWPMGTITGGEKRSSQHTAWPNWSFQNCKPQTAYKKARDTGIQGKHKKNGLSHLNERYQVVNIQGRQSTHKKCKEYSTIQGSVLSGILFLIYIMDYPLLFHNKEHTPMENHKCNQPTSATFVDDINETMKTSKNTMLQQTMTENLKIITEYMEANKHSLNQP